MSANLNIKVEHVTRVEGHGDIVVNMKEGKLEHCALHIVEAPRCFEAFVKDRYYTEAAHITSRICGICSFGHTLASVAATEDAFGITLDAQTYKMRKLAIFAEMLESHVLHLYFLVAPDLLNVKSVIPLATGDTLPVVQRALRMKQLSNDLRTVVGGRHTHPISIVPGGFSCHSKEEDLKNMLKRLKDGIEDLNATVATLADILSKNPLPAYERDTEWISLTKDNEYAFLDGNIKSTMTGVTDYHNYKSMTNEYNDPTSTAKLCKAKNNTISVGALARFKNNYDQLLPEAKKIAEALGFTAANKNPYNNNLAQLVELVHAWYESIDLIEDVLTNGQGPANALEVAQKAVKAGTGVGAVEVPRGVLYHEYTYNKEGFIEKANCIIPTGQNVANVTEDFRTFVPQMVANGVSEKDIAFQLEMLVRAYDPCISCSCHILDVKFVK